MDHYRFSEALLALDKVVAMQEELNDKNEKIGVRVYFLGKTEIVFQGNDAEAMRTYVRGRPEPNFESDAEPAASSVSPSRDVVTGRPLRKYDRKSRQNVASA